MGKLAKKIKDKGIRKFFSSDSYDRNLELMKLLVSDKRFQNIVVEARKFLDIPVEGLPENDDQAMQQWYDQMIADSDKILESRDFHEKGNVIRKQIHDNLISPSEARERGRQLDDTIPLNYYAHFPKTIAKQFNIPIHFKESIQKYIVCNKIDAPQHNYAGGFYESWERPWEAGYIPINIYTRLTTDEWEEFKNYVDNLAKRWLPKHSRIPKIDEYVEVEKVYNDREKESAADGERYLMSSAEISETVFGTPAQNDRVRDMLRKLDNLRKQRLTPKERGPKRGKK